MPRMPKSERNGASVIKEGLVTSYLDEVVADIFRRFESKVLVDPASGCWNWTGCKNKLGYGSMSFYKRPSAAHRISWELHVGPIPQGLHIDHLCRNPSCVNPEHLEPVTPAENTRRGRAKEVTIARFKNQTHCKHGHPFSGENLRLAPNGQRICVMCRRARTATYRAHTAKGIADLSGLALGAAASSLARKARTHCKHGHEYNDENTYVQKSGKYSWRACRQCHNARQRTHNKSVKSLVVA